MSLKSMFTNVAERYDLLNRILTWRLDEIWRETCSKECISDGFVVDLCSGTGDLALHVLKHVAPETCVLGLDFSKSMLNRAVDKKHREGNSRLLNLIIADATYLPFKNRSIDCIGVSFSFRNLIYRNPRAEAFLREVVRALRSPGKFVCVETSQPKLRLLRILYHLYLMKVVPLVGGIVSGRRTAYRYLGISATNFPSAEQLSDMLLNSGFHAVSFKRLTFGTVALHVAKKIR